MLARHFLMIPLPTYTYRIIPHARQSYFGPYFLDEKGSHPPLVRTYFHASLQFRFHRSFTSIDRHGITQHRWGRAAW